jgi:type III secretory pathway component EscS
MKILTLPSVKIRVSPMLFVVGGMMALEVVIAILALSLPWGRTASGSDIRFQLAGLLPWFALVPVLLQAGFLVVDSRPLRVLYMVLNFLIGAFIVLVQYLTYLQYSEFELGFYLVFILGALVILSGLMCVIERRLYSRTSDEGIAPDMSVT